MTRLPTMHEIIDACRPIGSGISRPEPVAVSSSDAFTRSLSPMARAKAETALDRSLVNGDRVITRRALVEEKITSGSRVFRSSKGERRLIALDGSYLAESQISKTAMDYAGYLRSVKC